MSADNRIASRITEAAVATCALAAMGLLAACAAAPKTAEQRAEDRDVVEHVQAEFAADPTLYSRHITVRADNGVVTLGGYAWTPEELTEAQEDAQRASGVTRVVNSIEVDRGAIQDSGTTR